MVFFAKKHPPLPSLLSYEAPPDTLASGYGISPTASLTVQHSPKWIELHYRVPANIQKFYHPQPGVLHSSVYRVAYLPHTKEGQRLLVRYQYAFFHGHAFSVGYSRALKQDNQVTWSSRMPHKTATKGGGPFGYPDGIYVEQAHQALDRLNVPRDIQTCHQWCLQQYQHQQQQGRSKSVVQVPINDPRFALRQETIHYTAPVLWQDCSQFSKHFELVDDVELLSIQSSNSHHKNSPSTVPRSVIASAPLAVDLATISPIAPPTLDRPIAHYDDGPAPSGGTASLRPASILTPEDLCKWERRLSKITRRTHQSVQTHLPSTMHFAISTTGSPCVSKMCPYE